MPPQIKEVVAAQPEEAQENSTQKQGSSWTDGFKSASTNQLLPPSPASSARTAFPIFPSPPTPSLIPNPRHASALPSRHLAAISNHVFEKKGKEEQMAWDKCVQYLDGKHALEIIAVRQGWKRKRVAELLNGWEKLEILVRARHW